MYLVYLSIAVCSMFLASSVVILMFMFSLSGSLHVERTKELYRDLLSVFDKLILPTHASCHVQYTLFYLCSFRLVSTSHVASVYVQTAALAFSSETQVELWTGDLTSDRQKQLERCIFFIPGLG